jgi:DNA-binding MarR family transcriptional regulator
MAPKLPGKTCLAQHSRMAARAVTRIYNARLRPLDLQITQYSLLIAAKLDRYDTLSGLAESMAVERTTLIRNVQLLEARGLVEPTSEGRGRAKRLRLTPEGARILSEALPLWAAAQREIEAALGRDETARALETMKILARTASTLEKGAEP